MPFYDYCEDEARASLESRVAMGKALGTNLSDAAAQEIIKQAETECHERMARDSAAMLDEARRQEATKREAADIRWNQTKNMMVIGTGTFLAATAVGGFMWLHRRRIANAALDTAAGGLRASRGAATRRDEIIAEIKRRADVRDSK